jgi:nucleotide-binding universal stress UspA family protein
VFARVPSVGPPPRRRGDWVTAGRDGDRAGRDGQEAGTDGDGVVVCTDGSAAAEAVVDRAAMLAIGMGAELHIVSYSDSALKSAAQRIGNRPLWFDLHAAHGSDPMYEVAAQVGADWIVVDRSGRHSLRRVYRRLFGGGPPPIALIEIGRVARTLEPVAAVGDGRARTGAADALALGN